MRFAFHLLFLLAFLTGARCSADVHLIDAAGALSNVGLLQVKTDVGFGSVCGANAAAADVARPESVAECREMSAPCCAIFIVCTLFDPVLSRAAASGSYL